MAKRKAVYTKNRRRKKTIEAISKQVQTGKTVDIKTKFISRILLAVKNKACFYVFNLQ